MITALAVSSDYVIRMLPIRYRARDLLRVVSIDKRFSCVFRSLTHQCLGYLMLTVLRETFNWMTPDSVRLAGCGERSFEHTLSDA